MAMSKASVRVYVRLRPVIHDENQEPEECCLRAINHNKVELLNWRDTRETLEYTFKQVFAEDSTQEEVFCTCVQPILARFTEQRQNVTVFTYGPTGAGKTFTILGTNDQPGIIPRTIRTLFSRVRQLTNQEDKFTLTMSYLEIYQEKVYDLLKKENKDLIIRQDREGNIFVPGLTQVDITNFKMFERLFIPASENRTVGATRINSRSSRSHSILQIQMKCYYTSKPGYCQNAKLYLIDLAGSEDNRRTGNTGVRLMESRSINTSLHVLSKVVDSLNANPSTRIPYRDSKLTRLLQDSLGGSAHTCMIVNVSPEISSLLDTQSTMNFATKSKNIVNRPFTREIKSDSKENVPPEQPPVTDHAISQKEKENSPSNTRLLPFLSPLVRKHVSRIESQLYSRLEDLEKLVIKSQQNNEKQVVKESEQASDPEEKFRLHDLDLDEIRKSSKNFKTLHARQVEQNEEKKRKLEEPIDSPEISPFIIKRKKISTSTAAKNPLPPKGIFGANNNVMNRRMMFTIERECLPNEKDRQIITIKVPAEAKAMHDMSIMKILNTGTEKELKTLCGIGSVRATQIFNFRKEKGDFEKLQDLERVLPKPFVKRFLENNLLHSFEVQEM